MKIFGLKKPGSSEKQGFQKIYPRKFMFAYLSAGTWNTSETRSGNETTDTGCLNCRIILLDGIQKPDTMRPAESPHLETSKCEGFFYFRKNTVHIAILNQESKTQGIFGNSRRLFS